MRTLITGIDGFVGAHLYRFLADQGVVVAGIGLKEPSDIDIDCEYHVCDLTKNNLLEETISHFKPDMLIHLAGIAYVPDAEKKPEQALKTNVLGSINVLDVVSRCCPSAKVVMVSTGEVYGIVKPEDLPLREHSQVKPSNFYAATKLSMEVFTRLYTRRGIVNASIVRPFNHIGPGQNPSFVTSDFARQIARIEKGLTDPLIKVGNLDARRDFTDVRDVARAYFLAAGKGEKGETYNIASGISISIKEILDLLLSMSRKAIRVEIDQKKFRESDVPELRGDYTKFKKLTGWQPSFSITDSLRDILEYWRDNS